MIRKHISLMAAVILSSSAANSQTVTLEDTPHPGDTTVIETITTGNPVTTDNLLSQQWNDGSWQGDMFPDSSDINENIYLTGKDGKYAESTINSQGLLTEQEIQQGLTSTLSAQVRWWNQWESTIEMRQTATNGIDTTTQSIILEDTTNHNNQFNSHSNTLTIAPNPENTHGTITARFSFDIDNAAGNWNNGHSGPDIIRPELKLNYQALSSTTVTTVTHCYEKTPPTCAAQDEIAEVDTFLDTFEQGMQDLYFEELYYEEQPFIPQEMDFEYSFNDEYFEEEEFEVQEEYLALDEFFFEEDYYQDDYYEEPFMEEFIPETLTFEQVEFFDKPPMEMFDELPPIEEIYFADEYFEEEMYIEVFTDDAFIEEFDEMFEEIPVEEMNIEMAEEMFEEMFEEYFEEEPPMEMVEEFKEEFKEEAMKEEEPLEEVALAKEEPVEEEPLETEPVKEEPIKETKDEQIEEQPSSEEPITNEPEETTDVAEQEEIVEEPVETPGQEPSENVEVDIDIKVAALEKVIQNKISNEMQRVSLTLDAVNEIVSKEMVSTQADISSYFNMNSAIFDTRQLPSGDPAFFMQASLDSYSKTIYNTQANLVATDPVVQYQIKLNEAQQATDAAFIKLKGLMDARSN